MESFKQDSAGAWIYKDPHATLDYVVDWTSWLKDTETITESTWEGTPDTVSLGDTVIGIGKTLVWLSGGIIGQTCTITNHITTSMGRQEDRSFRIKVKNR